MPPGASPRDADRGRPRHTVRASGRGWVRARSGNRWRRATDLCRPHSGRGDPRRRPHIVQVVPTVRPRSVPSQHRRQSEPRRCVVQLSATQRQFLRHRAAKCAPQDPVGHGATELSGVAVSRPDRSPPGWRLRAGHGSHSSRGNGTIITPSTRTSRAHRIRRSRSGFPVSHSTTQILSYGGFLDYDTRDNRLGLTRGVNLYGRVASAMGWAVHADWPTAGSKGNSTPGDTSRSEVPGRPCLRSSGQFKTPKGGSQIPFYDLSWLGGRSCSRLRSLPVSRRERLLFSTSCGRRCTHVPITVASMHCLRGCRTGLGRCTFPDGPRDSRQSRSQFGNWHAGIGAGLQYRHSHTLAARLEVSRGRQGTTVYWALSRGF